MKSEVAQMGSRVVEYVYRSGKPITVVLVNGSGGPLISWFGLMDAIAVEHSVLAYNRPGVGKSTPAETPQTASQMAEELHDLLHHLGISGVVVLVGHSLGGLVVLQFCLSFPQIPKAILLLEPSTVADIDNQQKLPRDSRNPHSELNFVEQSADRLRDLSALPPVPTVIGMGVKSSLLSRIFRRKFEARRKNLRRLAAEIENSRVVEFGNSGHFPQISEPKKVSDLIQRLCEELAGDPVKRSQESSSENQ